MLDATPSGTAANSYLTVAEADDLFDGFLSVDKWDDLEEADRERILLMGTRLIDAYPQGGWGERKVQGQRLAFPRGTDESGKIPEEVRLALVEFADYIVEGDLVGLKKLQGEGVTTASILGQSSTFAADKSRLPAGARAQLDRLIEAHWPKGVALPDFTQGEETTFFGGE